MERISRAKVAVLVEVFGKKPEKPAQNPKISRSAWNNKSKQYLQGYL
jgi:hypothetical protein